MIQSLRDHQTIIQMEFIAKIVFLQTIKPIFELPLTDPQRLSTPTLLYGPVLPRQHHRLVQVLYVELDPDAERSIRRAVLMHPATC
jgi:hypothetical protein